MHRDLEHHHLCTLELVAEGHAGRCPGERCAFWERGCALTRLEAELDGRPELARLLLDLRREIEAGREVPLDEARVWFSHILNLEEGIEPVGQGVGQHRGPAGGAMSPV